MWGWVAFFSLIVFFVAVCVATAIHFVRHPPIG